MKGDIRSYRNIRRKFNGNCECCGLSICACKAYKYTDDSNGEISARSQYLCRDCYEKKYGVKIPTEVEAYKKRLKDKLRRYAIRSDDRNARDMTLRIIQIIEKTD